MSEADVSVLPCSPEAELVQDTSVHSAMDGGTHQTRVRWVQAAGGAGRSVTTMTSGTPPCAASDRGAGM